MTLENGGPNVSFYDQYPSVEDDPMFKMWDRPVPESWFFLYRQWLLQQHLVPEALENVVVPEAIVPGDFGRPPASIGPYLYDALLYDLKPSVGAYIVEGFVIP